MMQTQRIESNRIESNRIESNRIESNRIFSTQNNTFLELKLKRTIITQLKLNSTHLYHIIDT
jgi:hypothetical protein